MSLKRKILIIEDNTDVRETTADMVELANYEVITAKDGTIGVKKAIQYIPDLILCDIMMPGLSGYDVFKALHEDNKTKSIPFVFLTAKSERGDIRKGMNMGADDYLTKPFEEKELLDTISSRLQKNDFLKKEFAKGEAGITDFFKQATEYINVESLIKNKEPKEYQKHEIIYGEGRTAQMMYLIEDGVVKTFKATETGKDFVTGIYKKGDFIGQLSLLSEEECYIETATALEETRAYAIPKDKFLKLLYKNIWVANKFISLISHDMVGVQNKLVNMAYASVRQRAAKALLELHKKGLINDDAKSGIGIPREDFAGIIGTATETAIRTLTDFKEEGLIAVTSGRKLKILNKKGIEKIADFN